MNLLKLSEKLSNISLWFRYKATYFEMKYYVHKSITDKDFMRYMKPIYPYMRNIGKSYALIKLALKYDIPIVVPTNPYANNLRYMAQRDFKSNNLKTIVAIENIRGKKYDTLLIEEMIPDDVLNNIIYPMCNKAIGYIRY